MSGPQIVEGWYGQPWGRPYYRMKDYVAIQHAIAFYPGRVDECMVDGEHVQPQPGAFYGGWITGEIAGPFKGEPGTQGW